MLCDEFTRHIFIAFGDGYSGRIVVLCSNIGMGRFSERSRFALKKNRTIPFGYCMQGGEIQPDETESKLVWEIFTAYQNGSSLKEIADSMTERNIPCRENMTVWNRNIIKRMLENDRYIGERGYPSLIEREVFMQANQLKSEKTAVKTSPLETIALVKEYVFCAECGEPLKRMVCKNHKERWKCRNSECRNHDFTLAGFEYIPDEKREREIDKPIFVETVKKQDIEPLSQGEQLTLFGDPVPIGSLDKKPKIKKVVNFPAYEISQDMIDYALKCGSNNPYSLERIVAQFQKGKSTSENAEFLQKKFGTDTGRYLLVEIIVSK